nr:hypothetical protein [Tanacetum cinerariifolium]
MESVKKSINERAQHKQEYDSRVNERQMQTTEKKVDTSNALDPSLVNIKSSGTESREQDTSSISGNDAHADDADIRPIYDEEPMAEVKTTAKINVFAIGQQHTEQPEFNNEGEVDQNAEQCHDTWKPVLQPNRNQFVVRQRTAFKSERPKSSKLWFVSQVDVNNNLSKPVTTHYLPKEREFAIVKPHYMIASSSSRYSSNDMVHNHYLEEAKKKTHESGRNSRPSVMPSAKSQSTTNAYKTGDLHFVLPYNASNENTLNTRMITIFVGKRIPQKKAAKRRKLSEEAQEAKDLRKRLEVVEDEDDDVFVEATPLASKQPLGGCLFWLPGRAAVAARECLFGCQQPLGSVWLVLPREAATLKLKLFKDAAAVAHAK